MQELLRKKIGKIFSKTGMDTRIFRKSDPEERRGKPNGKVKTPILKVIYGTAKIVTKLQRNSFDFNRNVTKSIRDAQFLPV